MFNTQLNNLYLGDQNKGVDVLFVRDLVKITSLTLINFTYKSRMSYVCNPIVVRIRWANWNLMGYCVILVVSQRQAGPDCCRSNVSKLRRNRWLV